MPIYRITNPLIVHKVWNAIGMICFNGQNPDLSKISRNLFRNSNLNETDIQHWIFMLLQDSLLYAENQSSTEKSEETYRLPTKDENNRIANKSMNDWYCFECHLAGDVEKCKNCHRVFHLCCSQQAKQLKKSIKCFEYDWRSDILPKGKKNSIESINLLSFEYEPFRIQVVDSSQRPEYDVLLCSVCNMYQIYHDLPDENDLEYFSYVLTFVLEQMYQWIPNAFENFWDNAKPAWVVDKRDADIRIQNLIFYQLTLSEIAQKVNTFNYNNVTKFLADVYSLCHNIAVFHGVDSKIMKSSQSMLEDCFKDLKNIRSCKDCFRYCNESNPKYDPYWFCLPCRPAHPLVWAKQIGYDYWPAKIIRIYNDEILEVKFFSENHEVAYINRNSVRPISEDMARKCKPKAKKKFLKAMEELEQHKLFLANTPSDLFDISHTDRLPFKMNSMTTLAPKLTTNHSKHNNRKRKLVDVNDNFEQNGSNDSIRSRNGVPNTSDIDSSIEGMESISDLTFNERSSPLTVTPMESSNNYPDFDYCFRTEDVIQVVKDQLQGSPNLHPNHIIDYSLQLFEEGFHKIESIYKKRLEQMVEVHNFQITKTKSAQWCICCQKLACYYCCWNTSYCSTNCQKRHWEEIHKNTCRRK